MHHTLSVPIATLLELAFTTAKEVRGTDVDLVDVRRLAPVFGPSCIVVEGDRLRIESRGEPFFTARIVGSSIAPYPLSRSGRRVELPETSCTTHVHPLVLAEAIEESVFPVDRIARVTLGRRCGALAFVETSVTARGREIVLYDEAGRFSMRLEGLTSSVLTRPASVGSMRAA